ncbi:MAG: hypothetical protein ABI047_03260 [Jatrophihabitantaceae bacterium]
MTETMSVAPPMVEVDLRADGLLWLINRTVFHPRGYALAVEEPGGALYLMGDGSTPWSYGLDENTHFAAVDAVLARTHAATVAAAGSQPPPKEPDQ